MRAYWKSSERLNSRNTTVCWKSRKRANDKRQFLTSHFMQAGPVPVCRVHLPLLRAGSGREREPQPQGEAGKGDCPDTEAARRQFEKEQRRAERADPDTQAAEQPQGAGERQREGAEGDSGQHTPLPQADKDSRSPARHA